MRLDKVSEKAFINSNMEPTSQQLFREQCSLFEGISHCFRVHRELLMQLVGFHFSNNISMSLAAQGMYYRVETKTKTKRQESATNDRLGFVLASPGKHKASRGTGRQHCVEVQTHRWRGEHNPAETGL